jgi:hypothetical protein
VQRDSSNLFSFQPAWTITDLQSTCWETLKRTISGGTRPAAFVWCWSVQCSGSLLQIVPLFLAHVVLVAICCNPRWTEVLTLIVWRFLPCFSYNTAEFCHADSYSVLFMSVPCINSIKAFLLFHNDAHNHKITGILKQLKILILRFNSLFFIYDIFNCTSV